MTSPARVPAARRGETVVVRRDATILLQEDDASGAGGVALYTVSPNFTGTGRVYVSERAGATATIGIALRKAGAALVNAHYVVGPTAPLAANEDAHTVEFEKLPGGTIVQVLASTANVSFSWVGIEEPNK